jgi:hypothetical protein
VIPSDLSFGYLSAELKSPVKIPIPRLYPMLNRHEIAGAEGEAINLRWEAEMQQASKELREIIGGR